MRDEEIDNALQEETSLSLYPKEYNEEEKKLMKR